MVVELGTGRWSTSSRTRSRACRRARRRTSSTGWPTVRPRGSLSRSTRSRRRCCRLPTTISRAPRASSTRWPSCARDIEERLRDADLCRDRVGLPGRRRGHARPGVRRSALRPAGRLPRERAALRASCARSRAAASRRRRISWRRTRRPSSCATSCAPRPRCPSRASSCSTRWRSSSASRCPTRRSKPCCVSRASPTRPWPR